MIVDDLKFVKIDEVGFRVYVCPIGGGEVKVHESVFYGRCSACLATLIDYKPAPHQVAFHNQNQRRPVTV